MFKSSSPRFDRRALLRAGGGASLAFTLTGTAAAGTALSPAPAAAQLGEQGAGAEDEFARLRARWRELVLGSGFRPTAEPFKSRLADLGRQAAEWRAEMRPAAGSLWPDAVWADPEPDTDSESYGFSDKIQVSATRLLTMATAYVQPGTGLTGDTGLRADVLTGMDHLVERVYNERQQRYGNWYNWQIGAPQALLDSCVLLFDQLGADRVARLVAAVDHFVPDSAVARYEGTSTGANRVDLCRVLALRGLVGRSSAKVALARDALSPVFPYVTGGDGLYRDGSFVQHRNVAYTGSYGAVFLGGLGLLFTLLADSTWQITDPGRQIVLDSVEHAWAPFLHNGLVMDCVSGRAISRGLPKNAKPGAAPQDDHVRGHSIIASIALMAQGASAAERSRWRGMVKGWLHRDRYRPALTDSALDVPRLARLREIEDDDAVRPLPEPHGHRLFAAMDRAVHRRAGWTAALGMASRRIAHYEYGNGENARGWHTGSGMLSWWADGHDGQYSDAFWPTVDPYRLPGTTVSMKRLTDGHGGNWGQPVPDADWVGGATDGSYAAVGQDLRGPFSTLKTRKSWFFADEEIVCLGAGISCADGTAVETVVDNRNLGADGDPLLVVDGHPQDDRSAARTRTARWAHLAGHGGYYFPAGAQLHTRRETRTGRWSDINAGGSDKEFSRRYQTLSMHHGTDPEGEEYAYVLLPAASRARTAAYAASARGRLTILANDADRQGIRLPRIGVTAVNFWTAGEAGTLTADGPCSVLVREKRDGTAVLCVADPSRSREELRIRWEHPVASVLSKPSTVTAVETGSSLGLRFAGLQRTGGTTQTVKVRLR
ncbi:polysaccharide lyase 8 family protein [Streptomyces sp. CA-250714]|uniref:polysaccharide lyase 8 family protein n=1 Tax=Streptomyces sp. CA-250714 TaxID=3240060 RepID=UPI003D8CA589